MKYDYGIQLYSIRDLASEDLDAALAAVAELGYKYVEFAGFFSHSAKEVAQMLEKRGLEVVGAHVGWRELLPEKLDELADYHEAIGNKRLIIPSFDGKEETLDNVIKIINYAAPRLAERGIYVGYHNHSFEFLPTDYGRVIFDELMGKTDAELELDIFWAYNAGLDPVELMEKYKDRMKLVHLKDGIPVKDPASEKPQDRSLGLGTAPVREVITKAGELGMLLVVESEGLEPSGREEVARCMEFLKENG